MARAVIARVFESGRVICAEHLFLFFVVRFACNYIVITLAHKSIYINTNRMNISLLFCSQALCAVTHFSHFALFDRSFPRELEAVMGIRKRYLKWKKKKENASVEKRAGKNGPGTNHKETDEERVAEYRLCERVRKICAKQNREVTLARGRHVLKIHKTGRHARIGMANSIFIGYCRTEAVYESTNTCRFFCSRIIPSRHKLAR